MPPVPRDALLEPSLQDETPVADWVPPPFNLHSILYVGFFGGPAAMGVIAAMQQEFAQETGIPSLKIKHNNVLGYFIETTATHAEKMLAPPLSDVFIHRQTTANALRFTTAELS